MLQANSVALVTTSTPRDRMRLRPGRAGGRAVHRARRSGPTLGGLLTVDGRLARGVLGERPGRPGGHDRAGRYLLPRTRQLSSAGRFDWPGDLAAGRVDEHAAAGLCPRSRAEPAGLGGRAAARPLAAGRAAAAFVRRAGRVPGTRSYRSSLLRSAPLARALAGARLRLPRPVRAAGADPASARPRPGRRGPDRPGALRAAARVRPGRLVRATRCCPGPGPTASAASRVPW